jgi:hypothetical protein
VSEGEGQPSGSDFATQSSEAFSAATAAPEPADQRELLQEAQQLARYSALEDAYKFLQKAVGLIAVTLPVVVAAGHFVAGGTGFKGSISSYYYTHLGTYFVGSLFALGVFFLSYNYRPLPNYELDNYLSIAAGSMAIAVALFPTASDADDASTGSRVVSGIHLVCAGALFVLLAVFALFLFTKTGATLTVKKQQRNLVYRVCGWIIVAAIVLVLASQVVDPPSSWNSLFWLESGAVVAFGVSWLVKGGFFGILADE